MGTRRALLSGAERNQLWDRWRAGDSVAEIARLLSRTYSPVYCHVSLHGGIEPRRRSRRREHLTLREREEISRGLAAGRSYRAIAAGLGRSPSTVSREVARGGGKDRYRAEAADVGAWKRAQRPKPSKLASFAALRRAVAAKLEQQWSPEQISGWLSEEHAGDPTMQVSHETIYRSLFVQARGTLKKELVKHLRTRRKMRRSKKASHAGEGRGQIVDAVPIRERPPEVEDRAVPGHWEGDLLIGSKTSQIATLVERHSRFVMLLKLEGRDATTVEAALRKKITRLPSELKRSLTWDRGGELALHRDFTVATGVQVYFCDPQSPWQRGSNENTNGLLRQYFPKGSDLSLHSQLHLNAIARRLNQRPRKTLNWQTPADRLSESVLR